MKRMFYFALVLLLALVLCACDGKAPVVNTTYGTSGSPTESSSDGLLLVLNDDGSGYAVAGIGTCSGTDIVIPTAYNGSPVTTIDRLAFVYCNNLTSITIPDSVTSIGDDAFEGCRSLTSITIGNGVTSIGKHAFYNTAYYNDEANWTDDVLYVGNHLIQAKDSLSGAYTIKEGTKCIASSAFRECSSLTSITIPESVTSIGNSAFYGCSSLTSITIPDSVTSIGKHAFNNTAYFNDETNWTNDALYIGNHLIKAKNSISGAYTIKEGTRSIGYEAFRDCNSLTSIAIPDSVTSIGDDAFSCKRLTAVYITDLAAWCNINFDSYYSNPLHCANNLYIDAELATDIAIPDSVTSIGDWAFFCCSSLTSVTILDSVTSIGAWAFDRCNNLTSITIPDSVTSIGAWAFDYTAYCNDEANWTDDVLYVGNHLLQTKESLSGAYTIKEGTKCIASSAFWDCSSLTSITIPESVTSIGSSAFYGCSSLTSITIPDSVTSIGNYTFDGCSSLTDVYFAGTYEQWNAITKYSSWIDNYTVHCIDGEISND